MATRLGVGSGRDPSLSCFQTKNPGKRKNLTLVLETCTPREEVAAEQEASDGGEGC